MLPAGSNVPKPLCVALRGLEEEGFQPILVGGMALVLLGSKRVTRDFDFLLSASSDAERKRTVSAMYKAGFCLISKLSEEGDVIRYIDNQAVAGARIAIDRLVTAFFWHPKDRLRVDLLYDFPVPAERLFEQAQELKIDRGFTILMASPEDLKEMKELALKERKSAADAQDYEFLSRIVRERKKNRTKKKRK